MIASETMASFTSKVSPFCHQATYVGEKLPHSASPLPWLKILWEFLELNLKLEMNNAEMLVKS